MKAIDSRPLIAHIVYRFDTGGLENGVVNLINGLPRERYRHAVIALTEITEFRRRVAVDDVIYVALGKRPGPGLLLLPALFRVFYALRPAIVHTRNLAALEATLPAALAGVPARLHGEHGWEIGDLLGRNRKYHFVRRAYRPFVTRYIALSRHLAQHLMQNVGIAPRMVAQIYNGVDTDRFAPTSTRERIVGCPFDDPALWIVGTVGRLDAVKDQVTLARAFVRAVQADPHARARLRLVIVGEGRERMSIERVLAESGVAELAWLPGERADIPAILRGFDAFVLPSLVEGISNTILEAMATGLPVIATAVGGNVELIEHEISGRLVGSADADALCAAMLALFRDPSTQRRLGAAARARVVQRFSLDRMLADYAAQYETLLVRTHRSAARAESPHGA